MSKLRFGKYTVETSNEDKVFVPQANLTKGDLIAYYREIAATMLPYLKERAVVMHRFPDGIDEDGFYHKDAPDFFPDWIKTVSVRKQKGGAVRHVICNNAATLVYLANQGCLTPHVWLSRVDKLHHPDQLIFDLDPPADDFAPVREAARWLRELMEQLGLNPFVKTSGSRGLHVMMALDRSANFDTVRKFARDAAKLLAARHPKQLTVAPRKNKRRGRLFLDTARNAYAQTAAPPYAVRPRAGAPVATPLDWHELNDAKLDAQRFTTRNIFKRLSQKTDPWQNWARQATSLERARKTLDDLIKAESAD